MHTIEQLINIILCRSETVEEEIKLKSDLKNLTAKQLYCIELIHKMDNPTLSELSVKLKTSKPSTTVMIDRMSEHGYIIKVKSDSDRRTAHVHLTPRGEKAAELHSEVHAHFAKLLTQKLTDSETEILVVLLNKAIKTL